MRSTTLFVILVVALIAIGIVGVALYEAAQRVTKSNTTTSTASPQYSSKTQYPWAFAVSINASSVTQGESIELQAGLTNIGVANQTIQPFIQPIINPTVVSQNGTGLWAWDPPVVTWPNRTVIPGQILSQDVIIPTSMFPVGQTYFIKVGPIDFNQSLSTNLEITMEFNMSS
jgi:hypothetical protein